MIPLSEQLCETLDLVYWKLKNSKTEDQANNNLTVYHLPEEQKELLKKILLAINIQLNNSMIKSIDESRVVVEINNKELIFEDVTINDNPDKIHLAGLGQMQNDPSFKKQTWLKLKSAFL